MTGGDPAVPGANPASESVVPAGDLALGTHRRRIANPAGGSVVPVGDRALLVTPARHEALPGLSAAIRDADFAGVEDLIPAAETILVTLTPAADQARLAQTLRGLATADHPAPSADTAATVSIPVTYDGEDLPDVARLLGLSVEQVIAEHTARTWTCRFVGFTAGFGYLEADRPGLDVPRRDQSRTRVPAGAVALAGGYSAVYPRQSPGGWQLIGTTTVAMWDLTRAEPALLTPGTRVRFEAVRP